MIANNARRLIERHLHAHPFPPLASEMAAGGMPRASGSDVSVSDGRDTLESLSDNSQESVRPEGRSSRKEIAFSCSSDYCVALFCQCGEVAKRKASPPSAFSSPPFPTPPSCPLIGTYPHILSVHSPSSLRVRPFTPPVGRCSFSLRASPSLSTHYPVFCLSSLRPVCVPNPFPFPRERWCLHFRLHTIIRSCLPPRHPFFTRFSSPPHFPLFPSLPSHRTPRAKAGGGRAVLARVLVGPQPLLLLLTVDWGDV